MVSTCKHLGKIENAKTNPDHTDMYERYHRANQLHSKRRCSNSKAKCVKQHFIQQIFQQDITRKLLKVLTIYSYDLTTTRHLLSELLKIPGISSKFATETEILATRSLTERTVFLQTMAFRVFHKNTSKLVKSGDRVVHGTILTSSIHPSTKFLFK